MKFFWKGEKIAFNIKIKKHILDNNSFILYLLLIVKNNRVHKYITLFKYILYYRISLIAISLYDAFIAIKQKHFNIQKINLSEFN